MASLIEDIKAIRKHKKISLNELYERTKVPAHIIEMIDNGSIFAENPNNKTYVRSFIRTYSKELGISNEDIIQALDDHEVDVYDGFLADKYVHDDDGLKKPSGPTPTTGSSRTSSERKADAEKAEADSKAEAENQKKEKEKRDENSQKSITRPEPGKPVSKKSVADDRKLDEEDEIIRKTKSTHTAGSQSVDLRPDITKPYNLRTPEPPNINSIDWADMVKRFNPLESKSKIYLTLASVVSVMLIGALVFYAFYRADTFPLSFNFGNGSTANLDEAVQLPIVPDTLGEDDVAEVARIQELPDTLELIIFAAFDKLEPVRIRSDINNILTPYWIEHGNALRTEFVDEILIRGQYSRMLLVFNGHIIENLRGFTTPDQFVRISREYLDDDPRWKAAGTDTFPSDLSAPSLIREAAAE